MLMFGHFSYSLLYKKKKHSKETAGLQDSTHNEVCEKNTHRIHTWYNLPTCYHKKNQPDLEKHNRKYN